MKMKIYRLYDLYVISLAILIACLFFYFSGSKPEFPIAIIAGGITFAIGIRQNRIENDRMFKELFLMFNHKYDEKFNNRLNDIDKKSVKDPGYVLIDDEPGLVIDYLNLCAEEYLWYLKGRIDPMVWFSWENGMKYYLNIHSIKKIVESERKQKGSYYGLFERLKL